MRQFISVFWKIPVIVILLTASVAVQSADISDFRPLTVTTGFEYQLISQEYYDAIWQAQIDTASIDPLEETWKFSRDKIDEFIFRTTLTYRRGELNRRLNIIGNMEYSGDRFLGRAEGYWNFGNSDNNLKLFGKIESKLPLNNEENVGEGYNYFQTYIKSRHRLTQGISLIFSSGIETIFFDDEAAADQADLYDTLGNYTGFNTFFSNYDYSIYYGRVGGIIRLSEFTHRFFWRMEYNHRIVPDSGESEYDNYRLNIEYEFFDTGANLDLVADLEFKNYARSGEKDDFFNLNLRGRWNQSLGRNFESNISASLSDYRFSVVDMINRDYRIYRLEIKPLKQTDAWGGVHWLASSIGTKSPMGIIRKNTLNRKSG